MDGTAGADPHFYIPPVLHPAVAMEAGGTPWLAAVARFAWLRAGAPGCRALGDALLRLDGLVAAPGDDGAAWDATMLAKWLPGPAARARARDWLCGVMADHADAHPAWQCHMVGVDRVAGDDAGFGTDHPRGAATGGGRCDGVDWPQEHLPEDCRFGMPVITLPVLSAVEAWPHLLDVGALLALSPTHPNRWWCYGARIAEWSADLVDCRLALLAGQAGRIALDGGAGAAALPTAGAVRLYRHPLDWLRAGGLYAAEDRPPPVCVLDWDIPWLREILQAAPGPLICDDREHAAEVHRITRRRPKLPEVHVVAAA